MTTAIIPSTGTSFVCAAQPPLTRAQEAAVVRAVEHLESGVGGILKLAGYAGTGKSTTIREIVRRARVELAVAALTGKAAMVLRRKGVEDALTLHSLVYRAIEDRETHKIRYVRREVLRKYDAAPGTIESFADGGASVPVQAVIVDEASMVPPDMARDLAQHCVPILYVGDPAQLPPIKGHGDAIESPDILLTEVLRQALESGILHYATLIRQGRTPHACIPALHGKTDVQFVPRSRARETILNAGDAQILVGRNETRRELNAALRDHMGYVGVLQEGERLICLRNNREEGLWNGQQGTVQRVHGSRPAQTRAVPDQEYGARFLDSKWDFTLVADVVDEEGREHPNTEICGPVLTGAIDLAAYEERQWTELRRALPGISEERLHNIGIRRSGRFFTYAYAITVHKAQGSEFDRVVVVDEPMPHQARWWYTAVTRAAKEVTHIL